MKNQVFALLIDYEFCTGCHSCEVACMKELNLPLGQYGIHVLEEGPRQKTDGAWEWNFIPTPTSLCGLCKTRVEQGKLPSCVQHCQAQVISFGPAAELAARLTAKAKQVIFRPL
jgi:Fe-S-cluster-containing dehydrogenase component